MSVVMALCPKEDPSRPTCPGPGVSPSLDRGARALVPNPNAGAFFLLESACLRPTPPSIAAPGPGPVSLRLSPLCDVPKPNAGALRILPVLDLPPIPSCSPYDAGPGVSLCPPRSKSRLAVPNLGLAEFGLVLSACRPAPDPSGPYAPGPGPSCFLSPASRRPFPNPNLGAARCVLVRSVRAAPYAPCGGLQSKKRGGDNGAHPGGQNSRNRHGNQRSRTNKVQQLHECKADQASMDRLTGPGMSLACLSPNLSPR